MTESTLTAWTCTIWRDGVPCGITLYGETWEEVEAANPGARVEGRQIYEVDAGFASDDHAWIAGRKTQEMMDADAL